MNGYKVSIHVETLEEAQAVQELALDAFGYPVTLSAISHDTEQKPITEWRICKVILRHMRKTPDRSFTNDLLAAELEDQDFKPASIRRIMSALRKEGVVYAIDRGVWRLVKEPAKEMKVYHIQGGKNG